jgi:hypothetical protein
MRQEVSTTTCTASILASFTFRNCSKKKWVLRVGMTHQIFRGMKYVPHTETSIVTYNNTLKQLIGNLAVSYLALFLPLIGPAVAFTLAMVGFVTQPARGISTCIIQLDNSDLNVSHLISQ